MHIPGVKRDVRKQQHIQSCVSNKLHLMMRALKKKKKKTETNDSVQTLFSLKKNPRLLQIYFRLCLLLHYCAAHSKQTGEGMHSTSTGPEAGCHVTAWLLTRLETSRWRHTTTTMTHQRLFSQPSKNTTPQNVCSNVMARVIRAVKSPQVIIPKTLTPTTHTFITNTLANE